MVVPPLFAADAPRTATEPGEPAVPEETQRNLPGTYEETPGAHAERPGKHSTTAGRHGTSGTAGGGVNTQSGSEAAPKDYRLPDEAPPPD